MKYAKSTNNKTALLAILAVFAMVAAGAAVVMASEDADAAVVSSTVKSDGKMTEAITAPGADNTTKNYYVGPEANVTLTLAATNGANLNEVYNLYIYQAANTYTVTLTGFNSVGANNFTINVYTAIAASTGAAGQTITYDSSKCFSFTVAGKSSATGTAVIMASYADSTASLFMTAAPAAPFTITTAYAENGAAHLDPVMPGSTVALNGGDNYDTLTVPAGAAGKYTITGATEAAATTIVSTLELTATSGSAVVTCGDDGNLRAAATTFTGTLKASPASGTFISEFDAATATFDDKTIFGVPEAGVVKLVSGTFVTDGAETAAGSLIIGTDAGLTLAGAYTMNGDHNYMIVEGTLDATVAETAVAGTDGDEMFGFAPSSSITDKIALGGNMVIYEYAPGSYEIKGTLQDNTSVTDATLGGDLVIPEGMTLTVSGVLAMKGYSITVQGTLKIQSTGVVGSQAGSEGAIILKSTGAIVNNGAIGKNFATTIKATDTSKIQVLGVTGFEVANVYDVLAVNGTITTINATLPAVTSHIITATGAAVVGNLSLTSGITLKSASSYVTDSSAIIVNSGAILGNANGDKVIVKNGGTVDVNGKFRGIIAVQVNDQIAVNALTPTYTETTFTSAEEAETVTGFNVTADRVQYTYNKNLYYSQRAYISGALTVTSGVTDRTLTLDGGYAFVGEFDTLTVGSHAVLTTTTNLIVLGEVIGKAPVNTTIGAAYQIKDGNNTVNHIAGFETAMDNIASAVSKTITLYGLADAANAIKNGDATYTIAETLELESGWTIAISAANNASLYIGTGAEVIVNSSATFDAKNIMAGGIGGKLIVMNGGACNPSITQYQVSLTDSDNNKAYASLEIILDDAEVGDEIILVGDSLDNTSITVPYGVKLTLKAKLSTKALTVSELALVKVENSGTLTLINSATASATMNIVGAVDAVNGSITAPKVTNAAKIKASGELVITAAQESLLLGAEAVISGAKYTDTYGNIVYTSVENAVEKGAKTITIEQDYTSSEDIVLAKNAVLTIADGKKATIGSIDISAGATVTATGALNATIAGVSGVDGDDDVTVLVSAFKGSFVQTSAMDGKGVTKYTFTTSGNITDGSVYVSEGTLTVAHTIQAATPETYGFILGADAAMVLSVNPNFAGFYDVVLAGKVTTATGVSMTTAVDTVISGDVVLGGTLTANSDVTVTGSLEAKTDGSSIAGGVLCILGTIVLPEDGDFDIGEGATVVWGSNAVGAGPALTGKLNLTHASAYVISYELLGEDSFVNPNTINGTAFLVNGEPYVYSYVRAADGTATVRNVIANDYVIWVLPGYDISNIKQAASWKDADGTAMANDTLLKGEDVLFYGAAVQQVHVKASWDTGMSLYVDNVRVTGDLDLDVGNHTVMVKANPGYKFADGTTPTITFNGKAVTGLLTINVTSDMVNPVLSATGDLVVDQPDIPEQEKEDNSMIMILLGVLVVMVVILAIVTVIRMMRS